MAIKETVQGMSVFGHFKPHLSRMPDAAVFERKLRERIIDSEDEPRTFYSDKEMLLKSTLTELEARGFQIPHAVHPSLPDLISKLDNNKCLELKLSIQFKGATCGFGSNKYMQLFEDGTFYVVWTIILVDEGLGLVVGRPLKRAMFGAHLLKKAGRVDGWDVLGVFSLGGSGCYLPPVLYN